jgi:glycerol-3-phosphate dehydrogenase
MSADGASLAHASSSTVDSSSTRDFDLIVIGAGINGAAVAREAALSGIRVLLLERGDVASGTSSASSRLIHGGLRYLEHGEISLVRESLNERERLLRAAPHLVAPLELYIPVYRRARRKRWQIAVGLTLYDWLSRDRSLPGHTVWSRDELLERMPGLRSADLVGGASYYDAQVRFPERLVVENVRDAVANGAIVKTYTRVTRIRVDAGRVSGVDWRTAQGAAGAASAPLVVNAAGPWVDEVLGPIKHTRLIGGTKGSHLIAAPFAGAPRAGVYVEAGSDARPLFILPWNDLLLVGTTDERFDGDAGAASIDEDEFAYLVRETERVFPGAAGLAQRVLYTHTGVRPLPFRPRGAEGAITRRHLIRRHRAARGLHSIVGGKLTTHRALAEDVLKVLWRDLPPQSRVRPTRHRPLPGALDARDRDELLAELGATLGATQADRLWHVYGGSAAAIASLAKARDLGATIDPASAVLVAELVYACETEWAAKLDDILQRRCMAGLGVDFGVGAAEPAARWLRQLGFWDEARAATEVAEYRSLAVRQHALAARHEPATRARARAD